MSHCSRNDVSRRADAATRERGTILDDIHAPNILRAIRKAAMRRPFAKSLSRLTVRSMPCSGRVVVKGKKPGREPRRRRRIAR